MILEYDGRIKYEYTKGDYYNGKYVNIISKNDPRYNMLDKVVSKKKEIIASTDITHDNAGFYFDIVLNTKICMLLCYDYNWSIPNTFEICVTVFKHEFTQTRTIIT